MRLTTDLFIDRAKEIHGDKYDYSLVQYVNMKTKVKIVCPKHGVFEQTPDKHLHGPCGCPVCANNIVLTTEGFVKKAKDIHGDKYDYSKVVYVNNKTPVAIICPVHGLFYQRPDNHLIGRGCAFCVNRAKKSTEKFIEEAQAVHHGFYDYSKVVYVNNKTDIIVICPLHGEFVQNPYLHLHGSGCPVCGHIMATANRDGKAAYEKAVRTFICKYGVSNPMKVSSILAKHKLKVSSVEVKEKRIFTKRKNNSFNTSKSELVLFDMLVSVFGENDILTNYMSDLYPFRCDFYIKSRDLYIELNAHWSHGGHWFNSLRDGPQVESWLKKSDFYINAATTFSVRDVRKRMFAQKSCLNYVVFWQSDLSDAKLWFSLDCPDGRDWDKEYSWLD